MPEEVFTFLMSAYDISLAQMIVQSRQPDDSVSTRLYYEGVIVPGIIEVDEDYAMSDAVQIERPLIVGTFNDGSHIVLDGYHRITRAYHCGRDTLPCYTLSLEETNAIRLYDQGFLMAHLNKSCHP